MGRISFVVMLIIACLFAVTAFASQAPPPEATLGLVVDLPVTVESICLGGLFETSSLDTGQIAIDCSVNDLPNLLSHDTRYKRLTTDTVRTASDDDETSWFANIGFHSTSVVC